MTDCFLRQSQKDTTVVRLSWARPSSPLSPLKFLLIQQFLHHLLVRSRSLALLPPPPPLLLPFSLSHFGCGDPRLLYRKGFAKDRLQEDLPAREIGNPSLASNYRRSLATRSSSMLKASGAARRLWKVEKTKRKNPKKGQEAGRREEERRLCCKVPLRLKCAKKEELFCDETLGLSLSLQP